MTSLQGQSSSPQLISKRVLIVEDDESIAKVLVEALSAETYEVQWVSSGTDAMKLVNKFKPNLVLTDYEMPGLTGLEMLKELRLKENYVNVILVSGRSDLNLVVDAFKCGADDYIRKPFRIRELLARVEATLRNNDVHQDLYVANAKLQEMVEKDYLTGLYNMRYMYDRIDHELKRSRRFKREVACVMMDMDHFKRVNDQNDHLFGSFVLKEMGEIIGESIREVDFAARYGGDEFLVVLAETNRKGVDTFCERIRQAVGEHTFKQGSSQIQLTISLGFALSHKGEITSRDLVREADHALYESKGAGRNRITGREVG